MPPPLKPNDIILNLRDGLKVYTDAQKGVLSIANNPFEVIELLAESTPRFRIVILWEGDEDATGQPLAAIVRTTVAVVVSQNRGLRLYKGESVMKDTESQTSLLTHLDAIRALVRAYRFPPETSDESFLYLGCAPEVTPEGFPLDAYRMRFRLHNSLPAVQFS